jgi:hypothetical protein
LANPGGYLLSWLLAGALVVFVLMMLRERNDEFAIPISLVFTFLLLGFVSCGGGAGTVLQDNLVFAQQNIRQKEVIGVFSLWYLVT